MQKNTYFNIVSLVFFFFLLILCFCKNVFADNMNTYTDQNIAFSYPADFLFSENKKLQGYDLVKGKAALEIKLLNQAKWQAFLSTYMYSQGLKEPFPQEYPVDLGGDWWLDAYKEHGFEGVIFKPLKVSLSAKPEKILLFLSRGEYYLVLTVWITKDLSLDLLSLIIGSIAFPTEASFHELSRMPRENELMDTPYSIKLNFLQKFGNREISRFNVSYSTDTVSKEQQEAVRSIVQYEKDIFEKCKEAMFLYYKKDIYPFFVSKGLSDVLGLHPVSSQDEMLDLVQFSSIFVLEKQADGTVPIGLRFFCNWSDEGLGLKLVNNEVVAVGNDYVALGVEDGWEGLKQ